MRYNDGSSRRDCVYLTLRCLMPWVLVLVVLCVFERVRSQQCVAVGSQRCSCWAWLIASTGRGVAPAAYLTARLCLFMLHVAGAAGEHRCVRRPTRAALVDHEHKVQAPISETGARVEPRDARSWCALRCVGLSSARAFWCVAGEVRQAPRASADQCSFTNNVVGVESSGPRL